MRKITFFLFICLILIVSNGYAQDASYELLWKIEKEGMNKPSYLFGTIHVRDERAFNFSDSVMMALENSDQFAMEIHPDTMMNAFYKELLNPDTTDHFKEMLSEQEYEDFINRFEEENGYAFDDLESKHPVFVDNILESNTAYKNDRKTFVDIYLYGVARTLGKNVHGLERVESQLSLVKTDAILRQKYHAFVDTSRRLDKQNSLLEYYKTGDLGDLENSLGAYSFNDETNIRRNAEMTKNLIHLMGSSSVFAAVGVAHLIGENSMIAMLRDQGYTVNVVPATFTGVADNYYIDQSNMPWTQLKDDQAGIILSFPSEPNSFDQTIPNPFEPEAEDSLLINIRMYSDITSMKNYIFINNDYPIGYYIMSAEEGYDALEEEILATTTFLSTPKEVYKLGIKGREYEILLEDKYYAQMQIFIRGNRTYKFVVHSLSEDDRELESNPFFDNVQFLPFKKTEVVTNKVCHPIFEIPEFNGHKKDEGSAYDYSSYFNNTISYSTNNPNSGGCYITSIATIEPLFRTVSLDSLYITSAHTLMEWNDSIIHNKKVMIDGLEGREVVVKKKGYTSFIRQQFWVYENQFIFQSAYADSSEIWSQTSNEYFQMVKPKITLEPFNLFSSKTKEILDGLHSKDSIIYKKAFGALDYYEFNEDDLDLLHQALASQYSTDTMEGGPASKLISDISYLGKKQSADILFDLYTQKEESNAVKISLLLAIIDLDEMDMFMELFFMDPPEDVSGYYSLFNTFYDSLQYAHDHFDQLLKLIDRADYRAYIIDIASSLKDSDNKEYRRRVVENMDVLTSYLETDLEEHRIQLQDTIAEYYYGSMVNSYLNFFLTHPDELCHKFLEDLYPTESTGYTHTRTVLAMVANGLEIKKSDLDSLIASEYHVFDLIKACDLSGQKGLIPDSMLTISSIAKYKLHEYMYTYDYSAEQIVEHGVTNIDGFFYHVFKLSYEGLSDSDGIYYGIVGPVPEKGLAKISDLKAYEFWVEDADNHDWESEVRKILPEFEDWAF